MPVILARTHVAKWMEISTTSDPQQLASVAQILQSMPAKRVFVAETSADAERYGSEMDISYG